MSSKFTVSVPLRLSLAGGGTDLPEYYLKMNTVLLTTALNERIELSFSKEGIHEESELNNLFKKFVPDYNVTISSQINPGSGLGGSGAIAVGLVAAKYYILNQKKTPYEIAFEAYQWEREYLKKSVGFQDQFSVIFGGCVEMRGYTDGAIKIVQRHDIKKCLIPLMEHNFIFIETGIQHESDALLKQLAKNFNEENLNKTFSADFKEMEVAILTKDICEIGKILKRHWDNKRLGLPFVTNNTIDDLIQKVLQAGAVGAKLIGAGGGGFILVCVYEADIPKISKLVSDRGYNIKKFQIDVNGVVIKEEK